MDDSSSEKSRTRKRLDRPKQGASKQNRSRAGRRRWRHAVSSMERELALPLFDRASVLDGKQRKARQRGVGHRSRLGQTFGSWGIAVGLARGEWPSHKG